LTVNRGYVPIAQLDPETDRVVSYYPKTNNIFRGPQGTKSGYPVAVSSRHHRGVLLTITTPLSKTRVTPDHRVRARFNSSVSGKFFVYLMRRGEWWRIGMTRTFKIPCRSGGLGGRMSSEDADAAWILGIFDSWDEAHFHEVLYQGKYGIPSTVFRSSSKGHRNMSGNNLRMLHQELSSVMSMRISSLFKDFDLDPDNPLFRRTGEKCCRFIGRAFETTAANLIPEVMEVPVLPPGTNEKKPLWLPFGLSKESYSGPVYGLSVTPHEHYVSGGTIVHNSACSRVLRNPSGSIVNNDAAWLKDCFDGIEIKVTANDDDDLLTRNWSSEGKEALFAMNLWDLARNKLCAVGAVYRALEEVSSYMPFSEDSCYHWIEKYEKKKREDDRLDFADLIMRVAGVEMTTNGPEYVRPEGTIPRVPVWIFDEAQDTSPLLDRAARRFCADCNYVYLFGDPYQGIYTWAGANPYAFMNWPVAEDKQDFLTETYRCARNIIDFGMDLLRDNDDMDREIKKFSIKARDGGVIEEGHMDEIREFIGDPAESTLILARTNEYVSRIAKRLNLSKVPWKSVRGTMRWPSTVSLKLGAALTALERGETINKDGFYRLLDTLPTEPYWRRGAKTFYDQKENKDDPQSVVGCNLGSLCAHGANQILVDTIRSGAWRNIEELQNAATACQAKQQFGDLVDNPQIKVATIHGSKGMQADRVILCSQITPAVKKHIESAEGDKEERRVWYVGATRARDYLAILRGPRTLTYDPLFNVAY
jgi:hypothetical protein